MQIECGLGYRPEIRSDILNHSKEIRTIEIIFESIMNLTDLESSILHTLSESFSLSLHCLNLSIGTNEIDFNYLSKIKNIVNTYNITLVTDHLAVTKAPGIKIGHLTPVAYTNSKVKECSNKISIIQDFIEKQVSFENITSSFILSQNQLTEAEFFSEIVGNTNCGILFDVTNLMINAKNLDIDEYTLLKSYPLESITQVHLSGGVITNGEYIDSHSHLIDESTWKLFEKLSKHTCIKSCIIEHDQNFPKFDKLLNQISRCNSILNKQAYAVSN